MSLMRFDIQLAIPESVYNSLPTAKKLAARDIIRELKALAVKINEGQSNEEMTIKASWHICRHDEGKLCDKEQEI